MFETVGDIMIKEFAKKFAQNGFYVFPTYKSKNSTYSKPYGWTGLPVREEGKQGLAIPATTHLIDIDTWDEQLKSKYKSELSGYGILGKGIVIFDIDTKDDKSGVANFDELRNIFNIPQATLIARSKSGGFHLFFKKPKKFKDSHIKSVASITIGGRRFEGVDVRGDGGYVQGATSDGSWEPGQYCIIKGSPSTQLSELPEELVQYLVAAHFGSDLDAMTAINNSLKTTDIASILRRGEIPDSVPDGARNESFFIYLSALKGKGLDRDTAKQLAQQLALRCENPDTLHLSVNIDDMLDRIFEKTTENPYDIAIDMVQRGLYQLMSYKSKLTYIMPVDNPYILSRAAHDLSAMRELMSKYTRGVTGSDGKTRQINPMDVAIRRIPDNQKADTIGYKPGAPDIFTMNDDVHGKRYLNMYQAPFIHKSSSGLDIEIYERDFKLLVSRVFGVEGSDEYQLGIDFCAWFLQYPELKCVIAPYIMSTNRGVGKSLLLNILTRIYGVSRDGERQARMVKLDDLSGRFFNPTGCLLNIVDEVQFAVHRNMRQETSQFWRHLKNLITADTVPVEIKGGGTFNVPNTAGLIMAGNKGGHFPIEELDRRVWIIDNNPPILERGTVDSLFDIVLRSGTTNGSAQRQKGIDAIRFGLFHHSIKFGLDSIRAPMSDLKMEMMKASMTDFEEWIHDYFLDHNNLIAESPIITRSLFVYMMQVSDQVTNERWRDDAEAMFRDAKRRGTFQPVKSNNITVQFQNIPHVTRNGDIIMPDRKEVLYTTREHGSFDNVKAEVVRQSLFRNLHMISRWKRESVVKAKKSIVLGDEVLNEKEAS